MGVMDMNKIVIDGDNIDVITTGKLNLTGTLIKTPDYGLKKKYNFAIYIGRFQPFHLGHLHVIKHGLEMADKLIIVIGSHNKPIDWKNPWTSAQRIEMIKNSLTSDEASRVHFNVVEDRLYQNKEWEALIYDAVDSIIMDYSTYRIKASTEEHTAKCCVVGYDKDDTSFYLRMFPQWKLEQVPAFNIEENDEALSATMIRDMLYHNRFGYVKSLMPKGSFEYVRDWLASDEAAYVKAWYDFDLNDQKQYEALKYGTNDYCADNVVFQ
jgi:bifunctional NMN adenylyltransferase/nudix hydrolase